MTSGNQEHLPTTKNVVGGLAIRWKIVLTVAPVLALALLIGGAITYKYEERRTLNATRHHLGEMASIKEYQIRAVVGSILEKIVLVANRYELRGGLARFQETGDRAELAGIEKRLNEVENSTKVIYRPYVTSVQGEFLAGTRPGGGQDSIPQRTDFRGVGHLAVRLTGRLYPDDSGGYLREVSSPVLHRGQLVGILFGLVSFEPLEQIAGDYSALGDTGEAVIAMALSRSQAVLLKPRRHEPGGTRTLDLAAHPEYRQLAVVKGLNGVQAWMDDTVDYRGEQIFAYTKFLDDLGIAISIQQERAEVFSRLRELAVAMLFGGLLTLFATVLVLILLARTLSQPIRDLVQFARFVEHGYSGRSSEQIRGDEFRVLDQSIENMAGRLLENNSILSKSVLERTKEVAAERDKALAAGKAKGEFLANMSHEIRTPMNGILGMLELVVLNELSDRQRQRVETIRRSANGLLQILNDILDFSKIDAGKVALVKAPASLHRLMEDAIDLFQAKANEKGLVLGLEIDPKLERKHLVDAKRLRQILFNLLGNAIKFTESGMVVVRADLMAVSGGAGSPDSQQIHLQVIDTGLGISEADQERLFQAYQQADSGSTRDFGGTGLGLHISMRLAELMGTKLEVSSQLGEGSCFSFYLTLPVETRFGRSDRLEDLDVVVILEAEAQRNRVIDQLRAWGAEVITREPPRTDRELQEYLAGINFDLVLGAKEQFPADPGTAATLAKGKPVILMTRDATMSGFEVQSRVYTIARAPLRPSRLYEILQLALGRIQIPVAPSAEWKRDRALPSREEAIASGELILFADDNPTNVEVISEQLSQLGFQCDVAENGAEALKKWQAGIYGLVITDCHMPVMDGYELTRRIRHSEGLRSGTPRIPIIAMTANVMPEERENCLRTGMDDWLSKPATIEELGRKIAHWLTDAAVPQSVLTSETAPPPAVETSVPDAQPAVSSGAAPVPVDLAVLKETFGTTERIQKMLWKYLEALSGDLASLEAAHRAADVVEQQSQAHRIKGAARIVGASALAETAERLENLGRHPATDQRAAMVQAILEAAGEVEKFVRDLDVETTLNT